MAGRRRGSAKKTPPTTVRLTAENHVFVKALGKTHPDGQSGVLNAAVTVYRSLAEQHGTDQDTEPAVTPEG